MTPEILVIAAIRIAGSLPVLRWPLVGGFLAVLVDLSDLLLRDVLELGGVRDYQSLDKWLDQVYMATFLIVALRWPGLPRRIAIALYAYRLVGFVAFELTGERTLLLLFPNASSSGSCSSRWSAPIAWRHGQALGTRCRSRC